MSYNNEYFQYDLCTDSLILDVLCVFLNSWKVDDIVYSALLLDTHIFIFCHNQSKVTKKSYLLALVH